MHNLKTCEIKEILVQTFHFVLMLPLLEFCLIRRGCLIINHIIGSHCTIGQFRLVNFASQFIRVEMFQIDFPIILSASKYFG